MLTPTSSACGALLGVLIVAGVGHAASTRQAVIDAAQKRSAAARSFHIEWEGTRRVLELIDIYPPHKMDETIKFHASLSVDATGQVRYRTSDKKWSTSKNQFVDFVEDTAFSRDGRTTFQDAEYQAVVKGDPDPTHPLNNTLYDPITLAYRTFDEACGVLDLASFSLTDPPQSEIHVVATSTPFKDRTIKVWFDRSRNFLPVRYIKLNKGIPKRQVDVKYAADGSGGWDITAWDIVDKSMKGTPTEVTRAVVTSFELGATFDADHFAVDTPNGVFVEDFDNREKYVLQDDGTRVNIDRGVTQADIHSLIETGRYADEYDWRWLSAISTALVSVLIVLLVVWWRRTSKTH